MAGQSPTELAREAKSQTEKLRTELDALRAELEKLELTRVRERLAVLEDQVAELKKWREESSKRHWQFVFIAAGAGFALLSSFAVQLVFFFLKK